MLQVVAKCRHLQLQPPEGVCKIDVLKTPAGVSFSEVPGLGKFVGKLICRSLFFNKEKDPIPDPVF